MKLTYDKEANAAYIYLKRFKKVSKTVPVSNDLLIDFGSKGEILGIEILNASVHMALKDLKGFALQLLPSTT